MSDTVTVAALKHIDRPDRCPACNRPMYFRTAGKYSDWVIAKFCAFYQCPEWLKEHEVWRG